jgi:hypothetical protein
VISEPEEEQSDILDGTFKKVYVREYWKAKTYDYLLIVKSIDGTTWSINNLNEANFTFEND